MKTKTNNIFKLLILFMTSLMLFSMTAPMVQYVFADDTTTSDKDKDKDTDKDKDSDKADDTSSASNYKNLMVPSILSTAYADGLKSASSSAGDSKNPDDKAYEKFYTNVNNILAYQNGNGQHVFSNVGTMFGQVGLSSGSSTNDIASLSSVTRKELDSRFSVGNDKLGLAYLNFGNAYTNLIGHANKRDTSSVGAESAAMGLTAASSKVANIGVTILDSFSPAPLILALRDSSVISESKYDNNKLMKLVRENEIIGNIVRFFGDPAPGFPMISTADAIVVSIMVFTFGLALLSVFMNGRHFGETLRKTMVKILVVAVAIPLSARLFDFGIGVLKDVSSAQSNSPEEKTVKTNLLLGPWANVTKFGLPADTTLDVKNNEFVLTPTKIKAINMYVAQKAGIIKDVNAKDAEKDVANYIKRSISADGNKTTIGWTNLIRSSTSTPWKTDKLLQVADALGGNKDVNADVKISDIGYLTEGGLISTPDGTQFSQTGDSSYGFGMTPIAAFNTINTTFDSNKLSVKSNLVNNLTLPTIAVGANTYMYDNDKSDADKKEDDKEQRTISTPINFVLNLVMLFAALGALAKILSAGFGGMLHGGASSTLGSAAGWGELIGAVIALIGGILGLSILISVIDGVMNSLWNMLLNVISIGKWASNITDAMPSGFLDSVGDIPWIGKWIAELVTTIINFVLSLVALFILPRLIKIPIEAFGTWASGLPGYMSEKAQAMENKFTGDYRAGGRGGGNHMANAAAKAAAKSRVQGQAIKTGAAMVGGAALNHMLSKNNNSSVTGDTNNNSEDKNKDGLLAPNESVAEKPEDKNAVNDTHVNDAVSTTDANEIVDGDIIDENEAIDNTEIEGGDESTESQEAIEDSDSFESVTAGDLSESTAQTVANDTTSGDAPTETDASSSVTGDEPVGVDDVAEANDAVSSGAEYGVADAVIEATSDSSIVDKSIDGDSIQSEDSAQSVQSSSEHDSVTQNGNSSDTSTSIDGGQEVNSSESVASSAQSINQSDANVDASQVSRDQSVTSQGGTDNRSNTESKTSSNMSQSSKSINAGDKSATTNNASITGTKANSAKASNTKRAQVSSRASRLVNSVKNNTIVSNVAGTAKGDVTAKEQAVMGAAHIAAGVVGAQDVTQKGVDNLNGRKGKSPDKNPNTSGQKASTGMQTRDEMLIRQQERADDAHRERKQAGGGRPLKTNTKTTTKSESSKTRSFFEKVSDKK